nr:hypothetical protein [Erwinia aphidicola]
MTISACSTPPPKRQSVPFQESVIIKCPLQLPRLAGNDGKSAASALLIYLELYSQCAARHNQLIDEILLREKINNG